MLNTYTYFGQVDAVINCVGIFDVDPIIMRSSINRFHVVPEGFFANLLGSVYSSYYFALLKGDREGFVLNASPMINETEIKKLSKYFNLWTSQNSYTEMISKVLSKKNIRFISISPSSMDTLMPDITMRSKKDVTRALVMDSVIKRYQNYREFVNLVIFAMTNSDINGVDLELDNGEYSTPPMVAKI